MKYQLSIIKFRLLKSLLYIFLIMATLRVTAPEVTVGYIYCSESVDVYERLINAVTQVESLGDHLAYNLNEEAVGAFQIRPIRILDYNQRTGKEYTIENCFNYDVSEEVFLYYAKLIGYPDYEKIARDWNGSGEATLIYWEKVKKHL